LDSHVFDRVEQTYPFGKPPLYLLEALERLSPRIGRLEVLRQKYPNMTDSVKSGKEDWHNGKLSFAALRRGFDAERNGGGLASSFLIPALRYCRVRGNV
jgi:hypothetical protein